MSHFNNVNLSQPRVWKMVKRLFFFLSIPLLALAAVMLTAPAAAQTTYEAGLLIQFPNSASVAPCVLFETSPINGLDLLALTQLDIEKSGSQVCDISGVTGCTASNCNCEPSYSWTFWKQSNGQWGSSPSDPSTASIQNGDVVAWVWGTGSPPEDDYTFAEICGNEEEATSTATRTGTNTLTPSVSVTSGPSPTPTISPTTGPSPTITSTLQYIVIIPLSPTPVPTASEFPTLANVPGAGPASLAQKYYKTAAARPSTATITPLSNRAPSMTPVPPTATSQPTATLTLTPTPGLIARIQATPLMKRGVWGILGGAGLVLIVVLVLILIKRR
jgi:hypothetical protein